MLLDTAGSALFTAGAGTAVLNASSSNPPKRSTSGCGAGAGGGAVAFRTGGARVEFERTGVEATSSSPALYSSYWRRLSLKEESPPRLVLLPPPEYSTPNKQYKQDI